MHELSGVNKFEQKIAYFEKQEQEILKLQQELRNKVETSKAELKAFCGITFGEETNILGILKAIKTVHELLK